MPFNFKIRLHFTLLLRRVILGVLTFFLERKSVWEQFWREEFFKRNKSSENVIRDLLGYLWGNAILLPILFFVIILSLTSFFSLLLLGKWRSLRYVICEWRQVNFNAHKSSDQPVQCAFSIQPNHPQSFENRVSKQDNYLIRTHTHTYQ